MLKGIPMKAGVHYVAGYLKQAEEELSGATDSGSDSEEKRPTMTLGKPTGSFR